MKKTSFAAGFAIATTTLLVLSGCQKLEETAQNLRHEGEKTIGGISQQAVDVQTKVLETKAAFDTKSQEVMTAVDAVNKVTH